MRRSAYDNALSGTQILGDPAMAVDTVTDADASITKYTQNGYTASDRIFVTLSAQNLEDNVLPPGETATFEGQVSTPFKPERFFIPSWAAPDLLIEGIKIGPIELLDGSMELAADFGTEVSLAGRVSFPTVETSQSIKLRITNKGTEDVRVNPAFYGVRLRK